MLTLTLDQVNLSLALDAIACTARNNSERWFPQVHDGTRTLPVAAFYTLGLAGEAGEVANVMKKALRGGDITIADVGAELADVFTYLVLLADELGVDLAVAYAAKAMECEARWGEAA